MTGGFKPYKPRAPGTLHAALTRAFDEAGGVETTADILGRSASRIYLCADPDADRRKDQPFSYEEARTLTRAAGCAALAEDLALLAGGVFLPPPQSTAPAALQAALATYSSESGEALAALITRAADGVLDVADGRAALKEIDEALRALMTLRAIAVAAAEGR